MGTVSRRRARLVVALALVLLGLGHLAFGLANFGFVESLPEHLDVLLEGIAAWVAAGSLVWAAANHVRERRWAVTVIAGGLVFSAGMMLSVSTGASSPGMMQVVIPVLLVGVVALLVERRSDRSAE